MPICLFILQGYLSSDLSKQLDTANAELKTSEYEWFSYFDEHFSSF